MYITVDDIEKESPFIIQLTKGLEIKNRTNPHLLHL